MKTKSNVLFVLVLTLCSAYTFAQRGVRIAYVDMEYILENVDEYRDANKQLADKVQKWKIDIEQKQSQLEQVKKDLMAERVLLTDELIAEREEDIQILEKEMVEYQQDRFGPQGDLVLQKRRLIQPIQDQVFNEVQKIGTNKKYDFIFDKSADVVMLYAENRHDISDLVLRGISRTRKISKPKKDSRDKFDDEEAEDEMSDALKERKENAEKAQEAREKTVEEKRAEQLKLREERKKAYEARRKKLLEEREAKRKEKLEERQDDEQDEGETEE
ncbi:OmpH family outer membrane protein [Zobellia barbeyronii]|uniref:OmpH family outer membrane protein n=1 Tax=Zobellia barbeyronii TaxID=2748009 RepID=A0ABS5WGF8_9FLAO|nr:OmpH family outer membrane protein [Zobellia barbeyronii]MBT2162443.1 OmpH family outer membrane protein [Zobellia barbeyronii]